MSKDEKKSSPSPNNHGLPFDPAHLLGVHSLAASAGLPFHHLAHLPSPYSLLAQPPAFPGLFGGLGAIPNPLHAAALSHSLAAASFYGLPTHPSELGSPPPPASSPSSSSAAASKGGKTSSSRSSHSSATATSASSLPSSSSAHRQSLSKSSLSSSPSPLAAASIPPYFPGWAMNGAAYPFHPPAAPSAETAKLSSSSRRSRKSSSNAEKRSSSSGGGSSSNSNNIPHAHQRSSSLSSPSTSSYSAAASLSIPTAHLSSSSSASSDGRKKSGEKPSASSSSSSSAVPEVPGFPFDPSAMITPYHMSPELAYLSQSLFLHRPDLAIPSPFLAASAAAAAAAAASSASPSAVVASSLGLEPGQLLSPASSSSSPSLSSKPPLQTSSKSKSSSSSAQSSSRAATSNSFKGDKKSKDKAGSSGSSKLKELGASSKGSETDNHSDLFPHVLDLVTHSDPDRLSNDPSHFMDDGRKKRIAESIRRRVGMQESMAALLSKHGFKHTDWMDSSLDDGSLGEGKSGREERSSEQHGAKRSQDSGNVPLDLKSRESEKISEKDRLEAELLKQEEQLSKLKKRYSLGEESMSSLVDESYDSSKSQAPSETEDSRIGNSSASENMDHDSQSGSESGRSSPESGKRGAEGSTDEGSPNKKRCVQMDERELTIPLEHGWNRQTIINGMGRRGIVGEVLYFAPCGKKMKTIPDVMRYLERHPNSDLGRENFSFNTKVNVGHFYEVRQGQGSTPVPLTDTEVIERIEMSRGKRARMQLLARKKREKAAREQALARQIMENKLKRRMELQEMSRRAAEIRFEKRLERQQLKEMEKKEREAKVLEKRKEKEHHKIMKQQEKMRIQEQIRREREMRAQQIIEARNRRQQELEELRIQDALKRNKEREMKRQQLIMMKEQERERRRQHLLLVKALEQRKKQEEKQNKERLREEKLNEKIRQKEMRMQQRRVEMEVAMELKKPVDDMELKVAKPLPKYPRMKTRLPGRPIADCLMVVEFLNNFGLALNLDKSSIPTMESLERGLMNDSEDDVEEFMSLVMHLLRFALDDVGVPNPKEAMTKLNQKITEMEMTDSTMSEILRIFVRARGDKEMSEWLRDKPMEALNSTKKAALLAFLCNELLTSKVVAEEIDKHMDAINNLRRDKWIVEGQLRQLRVFQARKFNKIHKSTDRRNTNTSQNNSNISNIDEDTMSSSKMGSDDDEEKEDEEDKEEEEGSGNESEGSSSVVASTSTNPNMPFEPVDESMSREESDKRIEKLRKQHAAYRQKVFRASLRLRAINIGHDRYKRMYWVLPLTGGVYVEGMESGCPEDYIKENTVKEKKEEVKEEIKEEIQEVEPATEEDGKDEKGGEGRGEKDGENVVKKENEVKTELDFDGEEKKEEMQDGTDGGGKGMELKEEETSVGEKRKKESKVSASSEPDQGVGQGKETKNEKVISSGGETNLNGELVVKEKNEGGSDVKTANGDGVVKGSDGLPNGKPEEVLATSLMSVSSLGDADVSKNSTWTEGSSTGQLSMDCAESSVLDSDIRDSSYANSDAGGADDEEDDDGDMVIDESFGSDGQEKDIPAGEKKNRDGLNSASAESNKTSGNNSVEGKGEVRECSKVNTSSGVAVSSKDNVASEVSETSEVLSLVNNADSSCSEKEKSASSNATTASVAASGTAENSGGKSQTSLFSNGSRHDAAVLNGAGSSPSAPSSFLASVLLNGQLARELSHLKKSDTSSSATKITDVKFSSVDEKPGTDVASVPGKFGDSAFRPLSVEVSEKMQIDVNGERISQGNKKLENCAEEISSQKELTNSSVNGCEKSSSIHSSSDTSNKKLMLENGEHLKDKDLKVLCSADGVVGNVEGSGKSSVVGNKLNQGSECSGSKEAGSSRGVTSDILRVPKVGHSPRDSLVSLLNHSIQQAYQIEGKDEDEDALMKDESSINELPLSSSSSFLSSASQPVSSASLASSILSSTLLFSAIPKLPPLTDSPRKSQSSAKSQYSASAKLSPILSTPTASSTPNAPLDFTPKSRAKKHGASGLDLPTPLLGSTPIPAHSKPINPQPLPPFHPSAQANQTVDQTPPAAHSTHKAHRPPPSAHHPLHLMGSGPSSSSHLATHHPQPPYIPGLPHIPYGPTSASETLSSLASIVPPPPAHHHPPITTVASSNASTILSSQSLPPKSTPTLLSSSTNPSSSTTLLKPPTMTNLLKSETSSYSSSELLQQAASQVLRSAEHKKSSSSSTPSNSTPTTPQKPSTASSLSPSPAKSASTETDFPTLSMVQSSLSFGASSPFLSDQLAKGAQDSGDHKLWFSILPKVPCDEKSLTQPIKREPSLMPLSSSTYQSLSPSSSQLSSSIGSTAAVSSLAGSSSSTSSSISALSTYLCTGTAPSLESLLPILQSNPSILANDPLLASLQLLTQPTSSPSPTPSVSSGVDASGDFKVPPPPVDPSLQTDPWDVLRAAQGEAEPIPKDKQHGWWRIYDIGMLRSVMPLTLSRGIREKNLQRGIHRYQEYARLHCTYDSEKGETDPNAEENDPPVATKEEEEETKQTGAVEGSKQSSQRRTSSCRKGDGDKQTDPGSSKTKVSSDDTNTDTAGSGSDGTKVKAGNNSASKGGAETSKEEEERLGDKDENTDETKPNCDMDVRCKEEEAEQEEEEEEESSMEEVCDYVTPDAPDDWSVKMMQEIETAALDEVEALEERIFHASLQAKQGWKPCRDDAIKVVDRSVKELADDESYPLDMAISRLLELEANIERRYMKPPLMRSSPLNISSLASSSSSSSQGDRSGGDADQEEDVPPGLLLWRQAVVGAESPAQLSLCTQLLAKSISWEKSIMRVTCQICRKDDNEAELLLCDGCDKGFHTYCFKPKMENIPEGDWFCYECVSKASGVPHCGICGNKGGKMVSCQKCPRCIHLECLDPPLPRTPKRWQCLNCLAEKSNSKRSKKRKESLPTVQRITITKLVVKEEPQDFDDYPLSSFSSGLADATTSSSRAASPAVASLPSGKAVANGNKMEATGAEDSGADKKRRKRKGKNEEAAPSRSASPAASTAATCAASTSTAAATPSGSVDVSAGEEVSPPPKKKEKKEKVAKDKKERKPRGEKKGEKAEESEKSAAVMDEKTKEKERLKDFTSCGKLLTELEKHEDGWPFLKPVNKKQFPSYRKYIKTPMDFCTAKGKLKNKEYQHRQDFAADIRLIFNNCETFNEDESEVGQAGFTMRQFFEKRWLEIFPDDAS
ncbi:uncharacterized protein LOC101848029 [Aplysia californica]|uniref:Uncharacterized protein LOC101848029 n=1 Tax=Aplysia californica TaxID=6500 RepID=A0ABM0ZVQ4_APLCA|nr:uncharacterized protein LOC101848029 [Aplysia californica]